MEIDGSAEKHEHPDHGEKTQGNKQAVDHNTQLRVLVYGQAFQHSHLLHNHQSTIREQETVPRDIKTIPDPIVLVALLLGGIEPARVAEFNRGRARASEILDIHEESGADIPDGSAHCKCTETPQHHQNALRGTIEELALGKLVGSDCDEGQQKPERPCPSHLDKISAREKPKEKHPCVKLHRSGA